MIYAKDSDVTLLDSSMNKVKVTVHDGVTGAYIEGKSTLNGVREIVLGEKSTGLFLKNTQPNFISSTETTEERRVGKECAPSSRSRWSPYH